MKTINLTTAEVVNTGCLPQCYSNRFILPMVGRHKDYMPTVKVNLEIEWDNLPWLMRQIWAAWDYHTKTEKAKLEWIESEIQGRRSSQ